MGTENEPYLPLDERFRNAEQYALDLEPPKKKPPQVDGEPIFDKTECGKFLGKQPLDHERR